MQTTLPKQTVNFLDDDGNELFACDLITMALQIETLGEKGSPSEWLPKLVDHIEATYETDLSVTQAWALARAVRVLFTEFKKKVDDSLVSLTTTGSTPSDSTLAI